MTLDQSLANLEQQADRLASLFASTADAIEERTGYAAVAVSGALGSKADATAELIHNPAPTAEKNMHSVGAAVPMPQQNFYPKPEELHTWPQTPQEQAPHVAPTVGAATPGAEATPTAPAPAPSPERPPWETQAVEAATAEVKPAKKTGRRTNEELAADAGVDLEAVKAWLGEGKRVTKGSIEEFAELKKSQAMNNQTLPEAAAPADPFGQQSAAAPAGPGDSTAVAPPWEAQDAESQFGEWPSVGFDPSDPFGS